ncbi:unnamed protein product [Mytilus coruscus]|uniref:Uncharacterized protein n=1 Tax=Mytilus coruscus TaxID=42192 RepID=A0A6J8A542_MYTCO|nr:unnamed protein product [Mytilus coruscus]
MLALLLDVELASQRDEFSIRQKPGEFSGEWSDIATKKPVIKDSKDCSEISALFHDDGTMRKSCKADLCHQLEDETSYCHSIPEFDKSLTVLIRDGMSLILCINPKNLKPLVTLGTEIVQSQLCCFSRATFVVGIFDRYDVKLSIKAVEQNQRSNFTPKVKGLPSNRRLLPSRLEKVLSASEIWQACVQFPWNLIVFYHKKKHNALANNSELTLAGTFSDPQIVKRICAKTVIDCVDLYSTHEGADKRMILYALYADRQFESGSCKRRIIVKPSDTDVLVLCVH